MKSIPNGNGHQKIIGKVPRYIRRIIHDTERCHYQREEYLTSADRNARYGTLRGIAGLVRYSDSNSAGIMVYVVAWPRQSDGMDDQGDGKGMAAANRKTTGGRVSFTPAIKSPKVESHSDYMELSSLATGKLEESYIESDSI